MICARSATGGVRGRNLGNAYAKVEKARGYYQQALAIGQQIKDPRIVQVCEAGLAELADQE